MKNTARAVMQTRFTVLSPHDTIKQAVRTLQSVSRAYGRRVFGMMVTNQEGKPVGMLSMYDIFIFLRPKHIEIWGEMDDIDLTGVVEEALSRADTFRVGDVHGCRPGQIRLLQGLYRQQVFKPPGLIFCASGCINASVRINSHLQLNQNPLEKPLCANSFAQLSHAYPRGK